MYGCGVGRADAPLAYIMYDQLSLVGLDPLHIKFQTSHPFFWLFSLFTAHLCELWIGWTVKKHPLYWNPMWISCALVDPCRSDIILGFVSFIWCRDEWVNDPSVRMYNKPRASIFSQTMLGIPLSAPSPPRCVSVTFTQVTRGKLLNRYNEHRRVLSPRTFALFRTARCPRRTAFWHLHLPDSEPRILCPSRSNAMLPLHGPLRFQASVLFENIGHLPNDKGTALRDNGHL